MRLGIRSAISALVLASIVVSARWTSPGSTPMRARVASSASRVATQAPRASIRSRSGLCGSWRVFASPDPNDSTSRC